MNHVSTIFYCGTSITEGVTFYRNLCESIAQDEPPGDCNLQCGQWHICVFPKASMGGIIQNDSL